MRIDCNVFTSCIYGYSKYDLAVPIDGYRGTCESDLLRAWYVPTTAVPWADFGYRKVETEILV